MGTSSKTQLFERPRRTIKASSSRYAHDNELSGINARLSRLKVVDDR
jgi:hypothetical protein